jgi:hypothetical protein
MIDFECKGNPGFDRQRIVIENLSVSLQQLSGLDYYESSCMAL